MVVPVGHNDPVDMIQLLVSAREMVSTQQTQNICITFVQRRPTVFGAASV